MSTAKEYTFYEIPEVIRARSANIKNGHRASHNETGLMDRVLKKYEIVGSGKYRKKGKKLTKKDIHFMKIEGENGQVNKITIPAVEGHDEIVIKISPADAEPNPLGVIPEEIVKGLGLKMNWRNIGAMQASKLPIYENTPGPIMEAYADDDEQKVPVGVMPKFYICRYDLIHDDASRWDCIKKDCWCVYMEKENEKGTYTVGSMVGTQALNNIDYMKKHLSHLALRLMQQMNKGE